MIGRRDALSSVYYIRCRHRQKPRKPIKKTTAKIPYKIEMSRNRVSSIEYFSDFNVFATRISIGVI